MTRDKSQELHKKVLFSLFILCVCRLGSHIPIPGIDGIALQEFTSKHQGGILGMLDILSGGSLSRMSIFALAIIPYITASIITQILSFAYPSIKELQKEGERGRKKLGQITIAITTLIATGQAYAIATGLGHLGDIVVIQNSTIFISSTIITLLTGTMSLIWLADQVGKYGLGNGSSLIIFTGIVTSIPEGTIRAFELCRTGAVDITALLFLIMAVSIVLSLIIFVEQSYRKIPIYYPKRQMGNKLYGGEKTYLPMKINAAGVIPPIFAGTILLSPVSVLNFTQPSTKFAQWLLVNLGHGKPLFTLLYMALIICMSFIYTSVSINLEDTSENLRKHGAYVPGRRPGSNTTEFFLDVSHKLTFIGATYLCIICILPETITGKIAPSLYFSGTSVLIVVNVVLDTMTQIQTFMFNKKYESVVKKMRIK
ncbi:preprotein translocase subunit SecY [Candidatus Sneabacter namystus]|uniref:Protein translocase subunit SecY n=1 Tax=Candidatus Sneabacter namystus TaxID=2601646 RepID=A0A5C0UH86_9RICK|nr:preprotein translocase subunit SecY [Candidatus Sneabacter namystus]QEK39505.1 preprotein translocase subunit SecY [Candidatus Sneabacter namystus]